MLCVDLPCHIELNKTFDNIHYFKAGEIGQIIIPQHTPHNVDGTQSSSTQSSMAQKEYKSPSGLTPPTRDIRPRRFERNTIVAPNVVREVEKMLTTMTDEKTSDEFEMIEVEEEVEEELEEEGEGEVEGEGEASAVPMSIEYPSSSPQSMTAPTPTPTPAPPLHPTVPSGSNVMPSPSIGLAAGSGTPTRTTSHTPYLHKTDECMHSILPLFQHFVICVVVYAHCMYAMVCHVCI